MDDGTIMALLHRTVDAVAAALADLAALADWAAAGARAGQHRCDVVADAAAVAALAGAGLGVWSEESGRRQWDAPLRAVLDPVDGSANASRGIPFFATSIAVIDRWGLRASLVANLATGERYEASRGGGARRDGRGIRPSEVRSPGEAVVAVNGWSPRHLGWAQCRALGSAALEMCAVADGRIDAFVDMSDEALAPWDYLGALLVCREAGASVLEAAGEELVVDGLADRRAVVAAASQPLAEALCRRRHAALRAPVPPGGGGAASER